MTAKARFVGCTLDHCDGWSTATWEKWGKLVKTWATGDTKYLGGPVGKFPWPTSPKQLQQQLVKAGVVPPTPRTVPKHVLGVTVLQMSDRHIYIVLPSAEDIKEAEDLMGDIVKQGDYYALPKFYETLLKGPATPPLRVKPGKEMQFDNCRTGEYVISYCG